ncbi:MAG: citramalate synthase [Verrucomicrobia bacterium Tous-C9LFEB]|nr:MAG: citramalate synthase [Verrucomicrobia bacterium Tous-C9LFEB]
MKTAVTIYDTTLRDGAQAEGINFSVADKLHIAHRLDSFGVHYIEGGWPGSNQKDIEFFQRAKEIKFAHAKLAAFGSTRRAKTKVEEDPQVAALVDSAAPVITLVGKTWLLHVIEVLNTTAEENLAMIGDTVRYLRSLGREVIYDAEHCFDGFKDAPDYALSCLRTAAEAGASYIVLCDTNGGTMPSDVLRITAKIKETLADTGVQVGIHTHDDCGLGVANALAAVSAGATQVQGTINGYGERTGNCNLITLMAALQLKLNIPVVPEESMRRLRELSLFVDGVANQRYNIRAPFVGVTAFSHKGGLHVNAINKVAHSYEHIKPELVGNKQHVLVGELSGRTNVMLKAKQLDLELDEKSPETKQILDTIKQLENEGYEFEAADASFELLVRRQLQKREAFFELQEYHVSIRKSQLHNYDTCEATIKLIIDGEKVYTVAEGDGPVNALDAALRQALSKHYHSIQHIRLTDYKVRILDSDTGTAAKTRVLIESTDGVETWTTVGVSFDIIEASWRALQDSVEYKLIKEHDGVPVKLKRFFSHLAHDGMEKFSK